LRQESSTRRNTGKLHRRRRYALGSRASNLSVAADVSRRTVTAGQIRLLTSAATISQLATQTVYGTLTQ
jgi:hypothetical protein